MSAHPEANSTMSRQWKQGKHFFSEEKKQKTFSNWPESLATLGTKGKKVFWFFFSKKNAFFLPIDIFYQLLVMNIGALAPTRYGFVEMRHDVTCIPLRCMRATAAGDPAP
jgi:hypothetical protein